MKKHIILTFTAILYGLTIWAIPAKPGLTRAFTLTDGTIVEATLLGDEYDHAWITEDGRIIDTESGTTMDETTFPKVQQAPRRVRHAGNKLNIAPRGLVILVNFSDIAFKTSKTEWEAMLNSRNYTRRYTSNGRTIVSSGSAWKYFNDVSFGQYSPVFDVVGPVTVSRNCAYYGSNNRSGSDMHPEEMVKEACELVEDSVDFSLYDNDNDGKVDFVYIFYAGYGEADGGAATTIWPHNYLLWTYSRVSCVVDGKRVDNYACSNELDYSDDQHDGIGTFCHEFSHVLGLPDLYVTQSGSKHKTLGEWDILDAGPYNNNGNTPPAYSAYERFFMGWLNPTTMPEQADITLPDLKSSNAAIIMTEDGSAHNMSGISPAPTTFYMLENRQQTGWDEYLPWHGMLITKIQYNENKWVRNIVNDDADNQGVDIIEADGNAPEKNSGKAGDAFPKGSKSFTDVANYQITNIRETNGTITFKVNGGGDAVVISDVENLLDGTANKPCVYMQDGRIFIRVNDVTYDIYGNRIL